MRCWREVLHQSLRMIMKKMTLPKHGCRSTNADLNLLFENLSSIAGTKPGVLSLVTKFSDSYVPKSSRKEFPTVLKSL